MRIFDYAELAYSGVTLPRQVKVQNRRLGLLLRLFQTAMLVFVIYNFAYDRSYMVRYAPVALSPDIWVTPGDSTATLNTDVTHCTDISQYAYNYSASYSYRPSACTFLPQGEGVKEGGGTDVSIVTFAKTYHIEEAAGDGPCADLEVQCAQRDGWFAIVLRKCRCQVGTDELALNPEEYVLHINHGYEVEFGDGDMRRSRDKGQAQEGASLGTSVDTTAGQRGQILTIVQTPDGDECVVGNGKSRWRKEDVQGEGVFGTLTQWMACGGWSLDDVTTMAGSGLQTESGDLRLRVSGALLQLDMYYYDSISQSHTEDFDGVVCYIRVRVVPKWNMWTDMAYESVPSAVSSAATYRARRNYGVSLGIQAKGSMHHFDLQTFITNIVNAVVLLSLPGFVIQIIAVYFLGVTSRIYYRIHMHKLDLKEQVAGSIVRLMGGSQIFRSITGHENVDRGLEIPDLEERIREALARSISSGVISRQEFLSIAGIVEHHLLRDSDETKKVGLHEFLDAYSANEAIPLADLEELCDLDRKRCLFERFFADSKFGVGKSEPILQASSDADAGIFRSGASALDSSQRRSFSDDLPEYDITLHHRGSRLDSPEQRRQLMSCEQPPEHRSSRLVTDPSHSAGAAITHQNLTVPSLLLSPQPATYGQSHSRVPQATNNTASASLPPGNSSSSSRSSSSSGSSSRSSSRSSRNSNSQTASVARHVRLTPDASVRATSGAMEPPGAAAAARSGERAFHPRAAEGRHRDAMSL